MSHRYSSLRTMLAVLSVATPAAFGFGGVDAAADPDTDQQIPEITSTDGRVVVLDDPSIVNSHPVAIDSWARTHSNSTLSVQFSLGSPDCTGVHADLEETPDSVTVNLRAGTHPDALHRMCTMIVVPATLELALDAPLGTRTVRSAESATIHE